jgi:hypothetical protein
VDPAAALLDQGADLALLPITADVETGNAPALLGRLDRDSPAAVPVVAAGFPRFKLRADPTGELLLREMHEANGLIAARSNAKTGTYEMARLEVVPDEDPKPDVHSPWEGMSGAAVWADQRLVGVVAQHHPGEGRGVLTVRPLEALLAGAADRSARWREVLGPRLPDRPGEFWLVRRASPGEAEVNLAYEVAARLAPSQLEGRDSVFADLDRLLISDNRWCWIQGEIFAGKTALLAWLVTHPPLDTSLATCFLNGAVGANTADYALTTLTGQLAALADRVDHQPARFLPEKRAQLKELLPAAARACHDRGRRLLLLIDGLDEYDQRGGSLREWLVGDDDLALPDDAALLVSSRSGIDIDLPGSHPLRAHVLEVTATVETEKRRALAMEELRRALADRSRLEYALIGLLAAAEGGLTPTDLRALLKITGMSAFVAEITDALDASLHRTVTRVPDTSGSTAYTFAHALFKDAARGTFADELAEFDATLLEWCDGHRNAGWPDGTPGYALSRYPRHLLAAGRRSDLVALLHDRSWYERHEAFDPSLATYLSGVEVAWQAAEHMDDDDVRAGGPANRLGVEIRACLTVSSVVSLSARFSPRLISALVRVHAWSPQRAFQVSRLIPTAEKRADVLAALAGEAPDDPRVVAAAMEATDGIADEMMRAWMWQKLAPSVPAELLDDGLRRAGSLTSRLPDERRPRAIAESALLARAAAAGLPQRALNAARGMENETDRARVLAEVAGALPPDRTDEALGLVRGLSCTFDWAEPLAALAAATAGSRADGDALLREAFDTALCLHSPGRRSWVLRHWLAPVLPESWMNEALDAARRGPEPRFDLLAALAVRLGALGEWVRALDVARDLRADRVWRVRALVAVAPHAPEPERAALAQEMFDAVRAVQLWFLPSELAGVAPHLTEPVLRKSLDWLDSFETGANSFDRETSTKAVSALLPRLANLGHPQEAYERALAGQEVGRRNNDLPGVDAWADLIPKLPDPLRSQACREAVRLASSIDDVQGRLWACVGQVKALGDEAVGDLPRWLEAMAPSARGRALRMLVPQFPALLPDAVESALTENAVARFGGTAIGSPRVDALVELAPRLLGPIRERALDAARAAASEVDDIDTRNEATLRVAAAFDAPGLATADVRKAVVRRIEDAGPSGWSEYMVEEFERFLPAGLVKELKEVRVKRLVADARRAEKVDALLAAYSKRGDRTSDTLNAAFDEACDIAAPKLRASALGQLAPHLMELLERQNLDDQRNDRWSMRQATVLETLAAYLNPEQLPDALGAALDLVASRSTWSSKALAALSTPLATLPYDRVCSLWRQALHTVAPMHRTETLQHLGSLGPVMAALGGQAAARDLVGAIEETASWWP